MNQCRNCKNKIEPFMNFGKMPIANGFLSKEQFSDEYYFDLLPAFCESCCLFQIINQPDPEKMFHHHYAFFSRSSKKMIEHFQKYSEWILNNYIDNSDPFVIELGSNDGIMLENFSIKSINHLGIEPSANVANVAREHGVNTLTEFFDKSILDNILNEYGYADVITAANVMCHIPDLNSVAENINKILKPDGVLIFEDPYLGSMIEKTSFDQIYDEHVYIFSAISVENIFSPHGFELINIIEQNTHGGSMRYVLARKGQRKIHDVVNNQIDYEKRLGLDKPSTYNNFRLNCEKNRNDLVLLLKKIKSEGLSIAGYAATSKSTTVLNYCGIGADLIEYISDTTPIKQGKYSPGVHIPIKSHDYFLENKPDYAILFAWNHMNEIMLNEVEYTKSGGKWILFVPSVMVE